MLVVEFSVAWIIWIIVGVALEAVALWMSKPGVTLSSHLWAWFGLDRDGIRDRRGWARMRRVAALVFFGWLLIHVVTGGLF